MVCYTSIHIHFVVRRNQITTEVGKVGDNNAWVEVPFKQVISGVFESRLRKILKTNSLVYVSKFFQLKESRYVSHDC